MGGKGNFIVNFITDERTELLVNSIGSYAGTTLLSDGSDAGAAGDFRYSSRRKLDDYGIHSYQSVYKFSNEYRR